ncbi:MAG: DUF2884 family protein [Alishewanella aestuarii]
MKALVLTATVVLANPVVAEQSCQFQLEHDLVISPTQVILQQQQQSLWTIDQQGRLWLAGKEQSTDAESRALLQQYQAGVREQAINTVELVQAGLQLAGTAVEQVLTELTGKSLAQHPQMRDVLAKIQQSTDEIIVRRGEQLEVRGSALSKLDQAFGPEFDAAIESLVEESMGNIMLQIGKAMVSGQGTFEQRMEAFGQRMEKFGEQLEQNMQAKASVLEQRGEAMCQQVQQLDQLESQIQQRLPAMAAYDLFNNVKTAKN